MEVYYRPHKRQGRKQIQAYLCTFKCGTRKQTVKYVEAESGVFEDVL